ncbi:hypothetical protein P691DRAFT_760419 [Macrolepiota fuliginosa MF-IS2]|uniref:Shieldin complex subunit 2 first OB fold domain-containing protein n=1 Tax=Macrolepiota fuliginosa MF-IS2 TaxID=1400762 RepID=A0A9P5XE27_9AGAR|nr:hypothetical protein P691DRAFT_760419 [Macrolepiota fuliginosa MF-IS2]
MSTYRVFLGAPPLRDLDNDPTEYRWENVSSQSEKTREQLPTPPDFPGLEALDNASRRISLVYQNVIFNEDAEDGSFEDGEDSKLIPAGADQTTAITWPPTAEDQAKRQSRSRRSMNELSFLNTTTRSFIGSQPETQETQETQSMNYSDASSIARFPTFHFSMHALASLTLLVKQKCTGAMRISILVAILEVEGPDTVKIKQGREAGKQVAVLKMILGDEGGTICKLTAWREVAERWGGQHTAVAVKRGDIVLIENVIATFDIKSSPNIIASPFQKSSLTICYRTMPYTKEDSRLRPDLRLGRSDVAVRKVAAVVAWFQDLAGLESLDV